MYNAVVSTGMLLNILAAPKYGTLKFISSVLICRTTLQVVPSASILESRESISRTYMGAAKSFKEP